MRYHPPMLLHILLACSGSSDTGDAASTASPLLATWAGTCDVQLEGGSTYVVFDLTFDTEEADGLSGTGSASDGTIWDISGPATLSQSDTTVAITVSDLSGDIAEVEGIWDGADTITGTCILDTYEGGDIILTR